MTPQEAANRVAEKLPNGYPLPKLDPAIIAVILELLKVLLPIIIDNCQETPDEVPVVLRDMRDPRAIKDRIRRWRLDLIIRRELGWRLYRDLDGPSLAEAFCEAGSVALPDEIWSLCDSL